MRPTYSLINLSNLKFNYLNIRRKAGGSRVMAVVKADAYGHGVKEAVGALRSLGKSKPEYFAVAIAEEAAELRLYKVKEPILVFEPFSREQARDIFGNNIIYTVFNKRHLKILREENIKRPARSSGKKIKVHIKIDTGMNRLGVRFEEAVSFVKYVAAQKDFEIDGIYTHFATSDERNKKFANLQLKRFKDILNKLDDEGIKRGLVHAANSGAILDMPEAYFDMVRPGISLYGYYPSLETSESIPLKPVMSLYSEVASLKEILPGESVSYGRKFTAKKKTKIAAVPAGYADGVNRGLTNRAKALIKGKVFPLVGRVTMDRIMFDVDGNNIKAGDKVTLLGKSGGHSIDAWDWGKILDTIPYEITCGISKRVPRIYKD